MSQKPFFDRLKKYYTDVGRVLKGEADAASIFPNSTDIGTSRESVYASVLKQHLPSSCNVSLGGFLFDQQGRESRQIDILVTNGTSIRFEFHNRDGGGKSFACIDGAVAVVSVKSTLDSAQLRDSLENLASLPEKDPLTDDRKSPLISISNYDDWPYKIVYASAGISLDSLLTTLHGFYAENPDIPMHKRPNLIHVAGQYVIVRAGAGGAETRDGTRITPNSFHGFADTTDVFALIHAITDVQDIVVASSHIKYTYGGMLNHIEF